MDILGPLPKCNSDSKYMLVFMESMSKWAEVFNLVETTAQIIARYFVEETVYCFGAPTYLKSDVGSNMIAKVINEAALLLGTKQLVTSPYRLQNKFRSGTIQLVPDKTVARICRCQHKGLGEILETYLFCLQCKYKFGFYPLPAILPYVWQDTLNHQM